MSQERVYESREDNRGYDSEYESCNEDKRIKVQKSDSELDSVNDTKFDSEFYSEYQNGNEAKRRKISDGESDSESDGDNESEEEIGNEPTKEICNTDKDGHIICYTRQRLGKYEFESVLGEGAFGRVLEVKNCITGQKAALKVIKNETTKRKSAMMEIIALTKIACRDSNEESLCIKMLKWFNYGGHICIAFQLLGISVFDFLKQNDFEPFSVENVRHIAHQLSTAVAFLHRNGITHTDLKPENILFVESRYTTVFNNEKQVAIRRPVCTNIRVIDFGNAVCDDDIRYDVISTRYYRAPEVILKLGWTQSCDIWAVGCTLFEIYFVNLLFPTHDDREHLAMIERVLGRIPSTLTNLTKTTFFKYGILDWNWNEAEEDAREYCRPLKGFQLSESEDDNELFDIVGKMLKYEQTTRLSMSDALVQPFFSKLPLHLRI